MLRELKRRLDRLERSIMGDDVPPDLAEYTKEHHPEEYAEMMQLPPGRRIEVIMRLAAQEMREMV